MTANFAGVFAAREIAGGLIAVARSACCAQFVRGRETAAQSLRPDLRHGRPATTRAGPWPGTHAHTVPAWFVGAQREPLASAIWPSADSAPVSRTASTVSVRVLAAGT